MRKLILAAVGLFATTASAIPPVPPPPPPAPPPALLVVISVDQLSSSLFEQYRPHFTGGLARLSRGAVFRNAFPAAPQTSVGDLLQEHSPQSVAVAVAGDRASAITLGGENPDQRWYWDGSGFATDLQVRAPQTIAVGNQAVASMIAGAQAPLVPPAACPPPGDGAQPARRFARAAGDAQAFAGSPAFDAAVLALSAGLVQELRLGADSAPDLLSIGLPATGSVVRRFGPEGEATCLQLLSLDRDLGDFFTLLDRGGVDYAVVLSASAGSVAGGSAVPVIFWRRGIGNSERPEPVSTADIVPTLASMLALPPPAGVEGKCLPKVQGIACPQR